MLTTTVSYRILSDDIARTLERTAGQPTVERDTQYYLANITKIKSIDDFIANDRIFSYAMKAFGLSDMTYAKAFIRKALEEGIDNRESFANSLSDQRYREFVETYNFARHGDVTTLFDRTQQGAVDRFVRQTLEEDAGSSNEGVRLALYFQRKAASIDSAYDVLADPALLKVVQTATRIPAEAGSQDIDRQAELILARLDIEDLQDPEKLQAFLTRFTSLWDIDNPQASAVSSPALTILAQPTGATIGMDMLLSLQNLKLGGP